jgi:hypothetical protein
MPTPLFNNLAPVSVHLQRNFMSGAMNNPHGSSQVKHSLGLSTKSRNSHSIQKPHVARQNLDVLPEGVPPSGMPSARLRPGLFLKKNISPFLPDRNLLPASKVSVDTYSTYLSVQRDRRVLLRPRWSLVLFRKSDASTVVQFGCGRPHPSWHDWGHPPTLFRPSIAVVEYTGRWLDSISFLRLRRRSILCEQICIVRYS